MKCLRLWFVLLGVVICFCAVNAKKDYDLTLFIFNMGGGEYNLTCVYSGPSITSSILWNKQDLRTTKTVTDFKETEEDSLNCDIYNQEKCTHYWTKGHWQVKNSLDYNFGHIFDYRLDSFKRTKIYSGTAPYSLDITNDYFEIPLSITFGSVEIQLSNGGDYYTFSLNGWSQITFTKVVNGNSTPKTLFINDNQKNSDWKDLLIKRNSTTFSVNLYDGPDKILGTYEDNLDSINARNFQLKSNTATTILHKYSFIYTETNAEQELGPEIIINNEPYFCVSMFVAMCNICKLKLSLFLNGNIIKEETFHNEDAKWKKIKFIFNESVNGKITMSFDTLDGDRNKFWAMDYVERCSLIDVRSSSKVIEKQNLWSTCSLRINDKLLSLQDSTNREGDTMKCDQYHFGKYCLNCGLIFGADTMCEKRSECHNDGDKSICHCRMGYYGKHCRNLCQDGKGNYAHFTNHYGQDCKHECGNCNKVNECNSVTGKCENGCTDLFKGDYCTLPHNKPVVVYPPVIIDVGYTNVTVKMNFTYAHRTDLASKFKFEYVECNFNNVAWLSTEEMNWSEDNSKSVTINGLMSKTKYCVKCVLIPTYNAEPFTKFLPNATFTTKCRSFKQNEISVEPNQHYVTLKVSESPEICRDSYFNYKLESEEGAEIKNGSTLLLTHHSLNSSTNYRLTFICTEDNTSVMVNFTTKAERLWQVQNVVSSPSANALEIKWDNPQYLRSKIYHYVVKYKLYKHLGCEKLSEDQKEVVVNVTEQRVRLSSLEPFSRYIVSVAAYNGILGDQTNYYFITNQTDSMEENEINEIALKSNAYSIHMQKSTSDSCSKIKGSIFCRVNSECMDDWCYKTTTQKSCADFLKSTCFIDNLIPFTNYSLTLNCGRQNDIYTINTIRLSKTLAAAPGTVEDLEVYEKDYGYLSIRFKPPYPPHGVLNCYKIKVEYKSWVSWIQVSEDCKDMERCSLWNEFYCKTIELENKNTEHKITVTPLNVDITTEGKSLYRIDKTTPGIPSKPLNLSYTYDKDDNVILSWTHPNLPNAPLKGYQIVFNNISRGVLLTYEKKLMYEYPINTTTFLTPANEYSVSINAVTKEDKQGDQNIINIIIPPLKPSLFGELQTDVNEQNISELTIPVQNFTGDIYVIISKYESDEANNRLTEMLKDCKLSSSTSSNWWIAGKIQPKGSSEGLLFPLGNGNSVQSETLGLLENKKLIEERYKIYVFLVNEFKSISRCQKIEYNFKNDKFMKQSSIIPALISSIVVLCIFGLIIFILLRKRKIIREWRSMVTRRILVNNDNNRNDEINLTKKVKKPEIVKPKLANKSIPDDEQEFSNVVKLNDFEYYVKQSLKNGELERQHQLFPRGQTKPWTYGMLPQNKFKNRYNNLIAYDHTRVILNKTPNDEYSDYINANYIEGYNCPKAYIATQGPKPLTINDFWKMVWQENVKYIVILTNLKEKGKKKTEKYWPDINNECNYAEITVKFESTTVYADFEHRIFTVNDQFTTRKVEQLHFISWPDHGVPLYAQSLLPFLKKILTIPQGTSPIVVHCSAGVGRTGTIILCDICLRMAAREGKVDVLRSLQKLREQRPNMVDNCEQYKLVHLVLLECLFAPETAIVCDENVHVNVQETLQNKIENQLAYLGSSLWKDHAMECMMVDDNDVIAFPHKDRFQDIVPESHARIFISRYPVEDESSSYINAVKVDGFRNPNKYIVTQQPLPNTINDFWRLIQEHNISVIISLNEINLKNETACYFWPTDKTMEFNPTQYLYLEYGEITEYEFYNLYKLFLHNSENAEFSSKRLIQLIEVKDWIYNSVVPQHHESLLEVLEVCDRYSCSDQFRVITCFDGTTACGLFASASFVIDKVKMEQVCDVCLAVRTVRHSRKKFVQDKRQFEYLYEIVLKYLEKFETYSNFASKG